MTSLFTFTAYFLLWMSIVVVVLMFMKGADDDKD